MQRKNAVLLRILWGWVLVGLLAWAGRAGPAPGSSRKTYGGVLRKIYVIPRSPVGVPWEIVGVSVNAATPALEALVRVDKNGRVHPWLAERWTVLPDQSTILFRLRRGVKFHDGTDFNAHAAKWNLDREMEARTIPVSSVEVVDEYTIRVRLTEYNNIWPTIFGGTRALMISPTAFTRNGLEWARWNPVGTGPFQIVRYERDVQAVYRRFDGYWQAGKPYLDGVEYLFIVNPETRKAAFLSGQANFLGATFQAAAELARESKDRYNFLADWSFYNVLIPSSANPDSPFRDPRVRAAVSHALDREAIVKALTYGYGAPADQAAFPDQQGYLRDRRGKRYDPRRARELLALAGFPQGFRTRLIATDATEREQLVAIQRYLQQVGIQAEIEQVPSTRYQEYINRGWEGLLYQPFARFPTVNEFVRQYWFLNQRFASFERPEGFEAVWRQSLKTPVPSPQLAQRLNQMLIERDHLIPVFYYKTILVTTKEVRDTGYFRWYTTAWWSPEEAWMAREERR